MGGATPTPSVEVGAVTVSLLGPVAVTRGGGALTPVSGVKLQSLLAMLALAVPHAVSDDRLLEELWGDDPPGNPANALQALVSSLRRVTGRDA
ncbi:MAG: helix-turn-helix domain-containing protein, partial [Ilumatobacteraceae bacterium]